MGLLSRLRGKKPKVLVLGLDGTPFTLLNELMERGAMPFFAELVGKGDFKAMTTSIPEVSSVAWTTFSTGVNPAKHGVFGFTDLVPGSTKLTFPSSHNVKTKTVWETLGDAGKRSAVLNIPSTYPAKPVNGVLVAGFVAIDLAKATYPQPVVQELKGLGYKIDVDTALARKSREALVEDLYKTLEARRRTVLHFLGKA